MLELSIEDYLVEQVKLCGGMAPKLKDVYRKGFPDRTVLMAKHSVIFVETKTIDGKLETWQKRYHDALGDLGFRVEVLWTIEQVDIFLESL